MADRHTAPSQSDQASERSKAEGERDPAQDRESAPERDSGRDALRTGRGGLDPVEVRDVLDETSEKHRRGEDIGASGISNPTLAEEQEKQAELPPRKTKTRKAGGGT